MQNGDLERKVSGKKKNHESKFSYLYFIYSGYSGIPDLVLRILKILLPLCFCDVLQPTACSW